MGRRAKQEGNVTALQKYQEEHPWPKWQVRDESFGLDVRTAEFGWQAIADVIRSSEAGNIAAELTGVTVDPVTGVVSATFRGRRYHAVPKGATS